jgi:hypothetical protein
VAWLFWKKKKGIIERNYFFMENILLKLTFFIRRMCALRLEMKLSVVGDTGTADRMMKDRMLVLGRWTSRL